MVYITPRELNELERFHRGYSVRHREPHEIRRRMILRKSAIACIWAVAALLLLGFFALLGYLLR